MYMCVCVHVCKSVCVSQREYMVEGEAGKRPSDRLHRRAQPVHCCHSLHLLTFSIMSFTHGCVFPPSYTSLITLLSSSPTLPSPTSFPPPLFHLSGRSRARCVAFFIFFLRVSQPRDPTAAGSRGWRAARRRGRADAPQMSRSPLRFMWRTSQGGCRKTHRRGFWVAASFCGLSRLTVAQRRFVFDGDLL